MNVPWCRPSGCGTTAASRRSGTPSTTTSSCPAPVSSRSTISFPDAGFDVECRSILPSFIAVGTGYGLEADWRHGMYQGPDTVVQGFVHEVADIAELGGLALVDHSGAFSYTDDRGPHSGFGLYEHSFSGSFPRYGLT